MECGIAEQQLVFRIGDDLSETRNDALGVNFVTLGYTLNKGRLLWTQGRSSLDSMRDGN